MSFLRLIYFSAVIGGWSAFVGWIPAELIVMKAWQPGPLLEAALIAALVGGCIGAGINVVAGSTSGGLLQMLPRLVSGGVVGAIGGLLGGGLGEVLFTNIGLPRVIGWVLMGCCIGVVEGIHDRSREKLRNGLIGGALGGLLGGLAFGRVEGLLGADSESGMANRAISFTLLGMMVGLLIGFVQVALKHAWLTVVDGFRPGRQLILAGNVQLGRADRLPLPLLGATSREVADVHVEITAMPNGGYQLRDMGTSIGTFLNGKRLQQPTPLQDGDAIRIGGNIVRFSQKASGENTGQPVDEDGTPLTQTAAVAPPPPPPGTGRRTSGTPTAPSTAPGNAPPAPTMPAPPAAARTGSLPPPPGSPSVGKPAVAAPPPPPARRGTGTAPPPRTNAAQSNSAAPPPPTSAPKPGVPQPPTPGKTAPGPPPPPPKKRG